MIYMADIRRPGDEPQGTRWYFDDERQRNLAVSRAIDAGAVVTLPENEYISDADEVARWLEEA